MGMALIIAIDVAIVAGLVYLAATKGLEEALPFFVFVTVLLPEEAQFQIPGLFNVTGRRVAVGTLVLLYLLFKRGDGLLAKTPLRILIAVHVAWCCLSTANSVVPVDSIKKMLFMTLEYYLMYYILVRTITQIRTVQRLIGAMVFAIFIACIFGAVEAYTTWRVVSLFPAMGASRFSWSPDFGNRFYSTFTSPHAFGAAAACGVVEAFYLLSLAKGKGRKIYLTVAILLMILNVYKGTTRGPWLTLALGFGLLFFVGAAGTRKIIVAMVVLTALVLITRAGIRDTILAVYSETVNTGDPNNPKGKSYDYRYALWGVATKALGQSPGRALWGYGLESFFYLHLKGPFYTNPEYPFDSCDSSWIELMTETGYVGLLIIAALLLKPVVLILRNLRKVPRSERFLLGALLINMLQYYFMMTNVALYSWGQTAYMLWMWIAMAMVSMRLLEKERERTIGLSPPARERLTPLEPAGVTSY